MLRIHACRPGAARTTLASLLVSSLALAGAPRLALAQRDEPRDAPPPAAWIEPGPALAPGQPAQLGYESPDGGYLTVLRATTNGDVSVVYPTRPNSRSTTARGAISMRADAAPGVGYLFWITSPTPFDFRQYAGRDGRWAPTRFGSRGGDPFEAVDRFARGTTHGRYGVGYSSYRVGALARGGGHPPAVHDGRYGDGYGGGYGYAGGAYGDGAYGGGAYGGDYAGWWGGPSWNGYGSDTYRYRRSWRDRENEHAYDRAAYADPRSRYLRHCADGTLAPYTVPCGAATSPHSGGSHDGGRGRP